MRLIYACLSIMALYPMLTLANPVSDDEVQAFRTLVTVTAEGSACPDPEGLSRFFGRYGLDLLSEEHVKAIRARFGRFAPILAASQAPGGALNYDIQRLYRKEADADQREMMLVSLRRWLWEDISQVPPMGSLQLTGPEPMVMQLVMRERVRAAEILADWDDATSLPGIMALQQILKETEKLTWHLERARQRLRDPCSMTAFSFEPDGKIRFCGNKSKLERMTIRRGGWNSERIQHQCSIAEVDQLWDLLALTEASATKPRVLGSSALVLEFSSGLRLSLEPQENGELVYTDNASLGFRPPIIVSNPQLARALEGLIDRKLRFDGSG